MERRQFTREFKLEAVRLIKERGVSYVQAAEDLGVHQSQLRTWVKAFADDPQHAFPGQGQMKHEQLEIAQVTLRLGRDLAYIPNNVFAESLPITASIGKQATAWKNSYVPAPSPVA